MGRRLRQFVTGGIYHIIQRGHNRSFIFNEQTDKAGFLDFIKDAREALPFHVLYYVLMDNHYHLIVEMQTAPFEKAMHQINLAYSKFYNKKYHCTGTVYGERYRAFRVADTAYLLKLILYIANNPVKAGLVKHPAEYRWCAHMEIVSQKAGIVSTERLFEVLGGTGDKGRTTYEELIRQNFASVSQAPTQSAFQSERRSDQLQTLLEEVLGGRATVDFLRSGGHDTLSNRLRREFFQLASSQGYKIVEIAHALNVTDRCVRGYRT
jgi:REP element-mobilizing transposase RayT